MTKTGLLRKLFLLLALFTGITATAGTPRLWEITGGRPGATGKFYILAVTHNALDAEYDDYLIRTVVPIAIKADAFFYEASVFEPDAYPACQIPLADTEENRKILKTVHEEVERADFDFLALAPAVPDLTEQDRDKIQRTLHSFAHNTSSTLSEYGLIVAMRTYLFNTVALHPERWAPDWNKAMPPIANYLVEQRRRRGVHAKKSIDAKFDLFDAYCNVDPVRRGRHLLRLVEKYDPVKAKPYTDEDRERFSGSFVESLQLGFLTGALADAPDDDYTEHLVCDRNDRWIKTMRQELSTGIHFYALGAAHVLQPGPYNALRCDGLLARLRQEGFSVTLLK